MPRWLSSQKLEIIKALLVRATPRQTYMLRPAEFERTLCLQADDPALLMRESKRVHSNCEHALNLPLPHLSLSLSLSLFVSV